MTFQMREGTFQRWWIATNPYTGRALCHDLLKPTPFGKTFVKTKDGEEDEEDTSTDDWQATNVSWRRCQEAQYWCNGMGYGR